MYILLSESCLEDEKECEIENNPWMLQQVICFCERILQNKLQICEVQTPKLNLAAKIFPVDSFVEFSSTFLLCGDLKCDLLFFIQLIWWIRIDQIFEKFDQAKIFHILLYT